MDPSLNESLALLRFFFCFFSTVSRLPDNFPCDAFSVGKETAEISIHRPVLALLCCVVNVHQLLEMMSMDDGGEQEHTVKFLKTEG